MGTVMSALIAAISALLGLFVGQYLTRWREDRTKRIQLTLEHAEKQLSEFYSPLLSLVEQLDTIANASSETDKAKSEERPDIEKIMWAELYRPVHDEILAILRTRIHLIEGFDIKSSFTSYLRHYASQKIRWQLKAKGHPIPDMKTVGYPESFYWDIKNGLYLVSKRYENSLQELRNRFLPELRNRFLPGLRNRFSTRPVIGFLSTRGEAFKDMEAAFSRGLDEVGYVKDGNVTIAYGWAESRKDRLAELAADLVKKKVTVIVAGGNQAVLAAKAATTTIPIVFASGDDPTELGLVLDRPSGNLTGVISQGELLESQRMRWLSEMVPGSKIATLLNPNNPAFDTQKEEIEEAARELGLDLSVQEASTKDGIDTAFSRIKKKEVDGLLVGADSLFNHYRDLIISLAEQHKLPAIYEMRAFSKAGGLMSYGTSFTEAFRQAGIYAGQILNATKPADLPIQQSTKGELVINLKTAKALDLTVPASLLARADEVIE
jgi:putative ABC transport system substrate-binding protein